MGIKEAACRVSKRNTAVDLPCFGSTSKAIGTKQLPQVFP